MLSILNFEFSVITITVTKIQHNNPITFDTTLKNYNLYHTPTESSAGGTLIYVSDKLNSKDRTNLNIYKSKELESTFVQIINKKKKKMSL